jgi:hypothetical protein
MNGILDKGYSGCGETMKYWMMFEVGITRLNEGLGQSMKENKWKLNFPEQLEECGCLPFI